MELALPPMPFSAVFVPEQGQVAPLIPVEMQTDGLGGNDRRITLPPGVVQVIVSWRGVDPLYLRHFITGSSIAYETVASIPATSSPEDRSTGVLTFSSEESHQIQVIHADRGQWNQGTIDNGYVVGVQVMPVGTTADNTGGGSLLRVDDSVGTRVFLGDQLLHGDTGWRNLGANGTTSWDFSGHGRYGLAMRRVNDRVSIWVAGNFDQSTGTTLFTAPDGFRQTSPFAGWAYASAGIARVGNDLHPLGAYGNGRDYYLWRGAGIGTGSIIQEFTWQTDDRWPSTLPGTAL